MKTVYRILLPFAFIAFVTSLTSCIVTSGITGPVYATDTDFPLHKVSGTTTPNDTIFTLAAGSKYRIVSVEGGTNFIKMMGRTKYKKTISPLIVADEQEESATTTGAGPVVPDEAAKAKTADAAKAATAEAATQAKAAAATAAATAATAAAAAATAPPSSSETATATAAKAATTAATAARVAAVAAAAATAPPVSTSEYFYINPKNRNHVLFQAEENAIKSYQRIITAQVAIGTMLLPIKIRGPIDHNNTHYERQFSTDISIGPFIGYRFKFSGNNYKTFTTIGGFAGPTLINYVSSTSQTGSPTPTSTTPDNMFAFTYGIGIVHEINSFQIGVVYGTDRVSGTRVKDWPYDGQGWFSLGIGYNFITAH